MARAITETSDYRDRLIKLIPGEFVAAYTSVGGIVSGLIDYEQEILLCAMISMAVLLPLYTRKILDVSNLSHIVAVEISFIVWAINIKSPFAGSLHVFFDPIVWAVILIIWTLTLPLFEFKVPFDS